MIIVMKFGWSQSLFSATKPSEKNLSRFCRGKPGEATVQVGQQKYSQKNTKITSIPFPLKDTYLIV